MYISLHVQAGTATLDESDDFTAFKVLADGSGPAELERCLDGIGRLDPDATHVFIDPGGLRTLAGARGRDPKWIDSLEKMIAYAAGHGWVEEQTGAIRAHIEQTPRQS